VKLKGLTKTLESLKGLNEIVNNKIESIQWATEDSTRDEQKDEMYSEAVNLIEYAIDCLEQVKELQLEDF